MLPKKQGMKVMDDYTYVTTGGFYGLPETSTESDYRFAETVKAEKERRGYGFGRRFKLQLIVCGVLIAALVVAGVFNIGGEWAGRISGFISADITGSGGAFERVRNFFTRTQEEVLPYLDDETEGNGYIHDTRYIPSIYDINVDADMLEEINNR